MFDFFATSSKTPFCLLTGLRAMYAMFRLLVCVFLLQGTVDAANPTEADLSGCIPALQPGLCLHLTKNNKEMSITEAQGFKYIEDSHLVNLGFTEEQFIRVARVAHFRNVKKFLVEIPHDQSSWNYNYTTIKADGPLVNTILFDVEKSTFRTAQPNERVNVLVQRKFRGIYICPEGFLRYFDNEKTTCFQTISRDAGFTFGQCFDTCKRSGAQMAVFDKKEHLNFLEKYEKNVPSSCPHAPGQPLYEALCRGYWIGTRLPLADTRKPSADMAYNMDGSSVKVILFPYGEPNGGAGTNGNVGERCLQIFFKEYGQYDLKHWNDYFCDDRPTFGCVCRKSPDRT